MYLTLKSIISSSSEICWFDLPQYKKYNNYVFLVSHFLLNIRIIYLWISNYVTNVTSSLKLTIHVSCMLAFLLLSSHTSFIKYENNNLSFNSKSRDRCYIILKIDCVHVSCMLALLVLMYLTCWQILDSQQLIWI